MNAAWMVYNKKADFKGLGERLGVDPVVARILVNRNIPEEEMAAFLSPEQIELHDPYLLKDIRRACEIIIDSISQNKKIRIIGDYDVDGIFSTYILTKGLRDIGGDVSYDIPHRIIDGYGMNKRLVEVASEDGIELIITCDNGIKAYDEIALARKLGMQVVVTDHHELGFVLDEDKGTREIVPDADAVVNPHQRDCGYPFKEICGAQVAWKLIEVVYDSLGRREDAGEFLDFAAFAAICDIMPLEHENRRIVDQGLKKLKDTTNKGLRALMLRLGLGEKALSCDDISFGLGPCFNACGRLDSAKKGVELLLEEDDLLAAQLAESIKNLNDQRKSMTEVGTRRAIEILESEGAKDNDIFVVYVSGLHESLAGIVAGRIKEKYYHPTFIMTDAKEGIKGSGRSIEGYSMARKLHDVEDILTKYGGHPMAAGVSMPAEKLNEFNERLNSNSGLTEDDLKKTIWIDVPMPTGYVTRELIEQLDMLAPFGEGNARPLFADKNIRPLSLRYMGKDRQYIKFVIPSGGSRSMEAVYFGDGAEYVSHLKVKFGEKEVEKLMRGLPSDVRLTFTYEPQINSFMGRESIQIRIEDYI